MRRAQTIGIGLSLVVWLVLGGWAADHLLEAAEMRPNILLILSDDHSAPHLGCYGDRTVRTPHLDRFASEGMRFDRAFTAAPQCVPSRASIITGRTPVAARITRFSSPLPPEILTLPELLRAQGYFTGICRRNFHLDGAPDARLDPVSQEVFQEYQLRTFAHRVDFLDPHSPRAQTETMVNRFFDLLPASRPFFLWVSFNDPHRGFDRHAIPRPHDPKDVIVPAHLPDLPAVRSDLALYYDEIARMDEEFQLVLDILKQRGFDQNTIVVFMGDNGHSFPHGKGSLYDPGLHVPLLVRWPGQITPGTVGTELVSGEDITPTLLEAAGQVPPKEMTGLSFLKRLRGAPAPSREFVFAERGPHGSTPYSLQATSNVFDLSRCVRSKKFKLIYNCTPHQVYAPVDCSGQPIWAEIQAAHAAGALDPDLDRAYFTQPRPVIELFDLESDPAELHNLAEQRAYAPVVHSLKAALQKWMILNYDYLPLPLQGRGAE